MYIFNPMRNQKTLEDRYDKFTECCGLYERTCELSFQPGTYLFASLAKYRIVPEKQELMCPDRPHPVYKLFERRITEK